MHQVLRQGKKAGTAVLGGLIVLIGIVLIPYPGPGWLIVFAGFAILATEFTFARKSLHWLRVRYNKWVAWLHDQPLIIRLLAIAFTCLVVLMTIYLLNTFGVLNRILHLDQSWLISPFFR